MIGIFADIIDGRAFYYVAEEIEFEKGLIRLHRLTGRLMKLSEAEKSLNEILKKRGDTKKNGSKD